MKLHKDQLLQWHTIFSSNEGSFITTLFNNNIPNHPLIIFYNEYDQTIYYLKGQTFKNQSLYDERFFYKIKTTDQDRFFKPTSESTKNFVYNETIFDISTIYKTSLEEFVESFELNDKYQYLLVNPQHQYNILAQMYRLFKTNDIAIKDVKLDYELVIENNQEVYVSVSTSFYNYVSHQYLLRNLEYENAENFNHLSKPEIIDRYNLDVRETKFAYLGLKQIIFGALDVFKKTHLEYANKINKIMINDKTQLKR